MKNFALIGAGGFIAPRHMKSIKDTGNSLVAAIDKHDSVGILDSFFPSAEFFTEFETFESYLDAFCKRDKLNWVSICSPNYLHSPHIQFGLKIGADVICEKPLVLNLVDAQKLMEIEKSYSKKVYTILQLRYHKTIIDFRNNFENSKIKPIVILTYITSRGNWYHKSWKADHKKSGGITANIGIHFFDMLMWVFGESKSNYVHLLDKDKASGFLELEKADVSWFLSIDANDLPEEAIKANKRTFRSIKIGSEELEFSDGFTDLHTVSYENILQGNGYGIAEALPAIAVVENMNNQTIEKNRGVLHPFLQKGRKF